MRLGIVGQGFVGSAVSAGFGSHFEMETFDLKTPCTCSSIEDLIQKSKVAFICVPTPMNPDGSCCLKTVEKVVEEISKADFEDGIVVIKSTVPPRTTENLRNRFPSLSIIFNPEFLTEAHHLEDFRNQNRIILGGDKSVTSKMAKLYAKVFPKACMIQTDSTTAEMVKYFTNCFLATKVSFSNDMNQLCSRLGINFNEVVDHSIKDSRLGNSHWSVPGSDGHYGFGGSCFPKDMNALLFMAQQMSIPVPTISGAWETNKLVRPESDWKKLKGRAVTA